MANVHELVVSYLEQNGIIKADIFSPFYVSSIGAHILHQHNIVNEILYLQGRLANFRVHIMFYAPPGFSKTLFIDLFLREESSVLAKTIIKTEMMQNITSAGFTGTIRLQDGVPYIEPGLAQSAFEHIVGIEEFDSIQQGMKAQYGANLDNDLLCALDRGYITKKLGSGPAIRFQTGLTMWAANQHARANLSSGLARRFIFIVYLPTKYDRDLIRDARRRSRTSELDMGRLWNIRESIDDIISRTDGIEKIQLDEENIFALFDKYEIPHYEEELFERLLTGYTLMKGDFDHHLFVELDEGATEMITHEVLWRQAVKYGNDEALLLSVIKELQHRHECDHADIRDMISEMHNYSYGADKTIKILASLREKKAVVAMLDNKVRSVV